MIGGQRQNDRASFPWSPSESQMFPLTAPRVTVYALVILKKKLL